MPISATYIILQNQIADELGGRTDLLTVLSGSGLTLSPIKNAIQTSIAKWEREPFYFNEVYNSATPLFTTVSGQELYTTSDAAGIATGSYITDLHALISANRWKLTKRPWEELEVLSGNPAARGQPSDWSYFAQTIRLYPIPDGAYPIRASRLQRLAALSADGDSNVWTQDGFDLIRSEAKRFLAVEMLYDVALATAMEFAIYGNPANPRDRGYLGVLKAESTRRARSRIRPTSF